jgi:cytoskeletal protein CcmA (bactofilin family)
MELVMWWEKKRRPVAPQFVKPRATPPATLELEQAMSETTGKLANQPPCGSPQTVLGRTTVMRGQLSGNEDLLIDGQFEGTITLQDHCVTVGTDGQVKAEIQARQVAVLGSVVGNISAREKIAIRRTGHVVGDLVAAAVAIEEGAYFKGSIDILREEPQEVVRAVAASSAFSSGS